MKIDRLIGIITILLQRDKVTAPELAERFEVSRRTITRDIENLCKAGIPIIAIPGYGGGISIDDRYKIDKTLFSKDELLTILAGVQGIDSVKLNSGKPSISEKLSLSSEDMVSDSFLKIDLASHYKEAVSEKINLIKTAILDHRLITFQYCNSNGETNRYVEPYRVLFEWSDWYVFGFCRTRQDFRVFKLNRLYNMKICSDRFEPRKTPSEQDIFGNYFSNTPYKLKAQFNKSVKYRLIEEYDENCFSVLDNGNLFFESTFSSYDNMLEWVLSFGDKVQVIEPKKLKEDILKQAKNILKKNVEQDI